MLQTRMNELVSGIRLQLQQIEQSIHKVQKNINVTLQREGILLENSAIQIAEKRVEKQSLIAKMYLGRKHIILTPRCDSSSIEKLEFHQLMLYCKPPE